MNFKSIKKQLVNFSEKTLRRTGFSDKVICNFLRCLHFGISLLLGLVLLFSTKKWFLIVLVVNIIVSIMFYIFDGCILSTLEHRFTNDDFTVIDPLLICLKMELTNSNRYTATIVSNIFTFFLVAALYCYRFGWPLKDS